MPILTLVGGKLAAMFVPLLFTLGLLFVKHVRADGSFDTDAIKAEFMAVLSGPEGPNVPGALKPVESWASGFMVDCASAFIAKLGIAAAIEHLVEKLRKEAQGLDLLSPPAAQLPAAEAASA